MPGSKLSPRWYQVSLSQLTLLSVCSKRNRFRELFRASELEEFGNARPANPARFRQVRQFCSLAIPNLGDMIQSQVNPKFYSGHNGKIKLVSSILGFIMFVFLFVNTVDIAVEAGWPLGMKRGLMEWSWICLAAFSAIIVTIPIPFNFGYPPSGHVDPSSGRFTWRRRAISSVSSALVYFLAHRYFKWVN